MNEMRLTDLATQFATICGAAHVQRGESIDTRYQSDWLGTKDSAPAIVVRPGETDEVAAIMKLCAETRTPVIPFGGNSGLAGGTIAVIAGGIDVYYPPENTELQDAIAETGLIIAEMPPGTQPTPRHFPIRNRVIGSLALGTVVVEAAERSGSLITARETAEAATGSAAVDTEAAAVDTAEAEADEETTKTNRTN